jgi:hypothetical protein
VVGTALRRQIGEIGRGATLQPAGGDTSVLPPHEARLEAAPMRRAGQQIGETRRGAGLRTACGDRLALGVGAATIGATAARACRRTASV